MCVFVCVSIETWVIVVLLTPNHSIPSSFFCFFVFVLFFFVEQVGVIHMSYIQISASDVC